MARWGWIRIVGVADAGETVAIYLPAGGESAAPSGVCLAVCSDRELVIVAARIEPEALAALAVQELGRRKLAGL
jgi:riboflavin synthase alpha subunit